MSFVKRHPGLTLALISTSGIILVLGITEFFCRTVLGLGDPLLYQSSPLYGYRLQANQMVERRGAQIRVNNLGLRAESDWDTSRDGKILFLGNSVTFGGTSISDKDLFSHLAVENLGGYTAGNGGVNGWGVENIHALVVEYGFLPSKVYVTVLQDMDFERGLSKLAGKPFRSEKPLLALEEVLFALLYNGLQHLHEGHDRFVRPLEYEKSIARSAAKLKEMDDYLRSLGFLHLVYMSTDKYQLHGETRPDSLVRKYLDLYNIPVQFLADRAEIRSLPPDEIDLLFYDWNHLNIKGHRLWAKMIGEDLTKLIQTTSPQ
jgi:hypothetical protein